MKRAPEAATVAFLEELAHRLGGRPLLIPTTDATTVFVAQHAAPLAASFRFPRRSCELVRSFSDKGEAFRLARRLGIATPAAAFPRSSDDVREFAARATFPLMLKGIDGTRLQRRMGRKMVIVRSERELAAEYTRLEEPGAHNLMLQEYIPGGDDTVWMFNGYFNTDSDCLVAFTGKKLRQHAVHVGATSLGICLPNQAIAELTTSFMKRVGYCGILDIGYRYDARDGVYKLLDPNPRIGGTFRLFVAQTGMDVAGCRAGGGRWCTLSPRQRSKFARLRASTALVRSPRPALQDHHRHCARHDAQVLDDGLARQVLQVVGDLGAHAFHRGVVMQVDLSPPGDTRAHALAPRVAVDLLAQVGKDPRLLWPGPDHVHVAPQHVEQLRQLVQPILPEHPAERGHSRVVQLGPHLPVAAPVHAHGAELVDREGLTADVGLPAGVRGRGPRPAAVEPHPRLGVQHGPARGELDERGDAQHQRRRPHHSHAGHEKVETAPRTFGALPARALRWRAAGRGRGWRDAAA